MANTPIIAGIQTSACLSLNVAAGIVRALVAREVITGADASEILTGIADDTLSDCETPAENQAAQAFCAWLREQAASYA